MRDITQSELADILEKHSKWLRGEADGEQANLSGANLWKANLWKANLRGANLRGANLSEANLREANLRGANLRGAYLTEANLSWANLSEANHIGANLSGANLSWASGIYSMQLSAHPIVVWFNRESNEYIVRVGCEEHSIGHWLANHESIGQENNYSELQCEEYGIQFQSIKQLIQLWTTGDTNE